ncbi:Uncharacterised protein [Mycobacteroides abscessus subsp. bolletii]|uniref:hypothetical protein n=1 Tax=Mycobacteroides abscessus TaxID=36809 RepID=UPI00092ACF5B|nr:hypothetical protein [Mycobacteroides abscessus]SHY85581.1 Uncharacterised protein [Mycobacteroides abscessus subsp. bolletii]SKQ60682.1 Uncharacterised protein [Mycobacteroides abscessus subsp. bolletii]SKQ62245.1 Uncharacterised protein [Mycobacteroides abscessus subsp. bolletii]SKQ65013.1 Uncharacterised protein [Mycobacteroides abscessus subsp. bolletii]
MADTFDADPNTLPLITKAFRQSWITHNPGGSSGAPLDAVATTFSMRAALDATHSSSASSRSKPPRPRRHGVKPHHHLSCNCSRGAMRCHDPNG